MGQVLYNPARENFEGWGNCKINSLIEMQELRLCNKGWGWLKR
jgi:hypothetical protein